MEQYVRPAVATREFRDDEGNVIPYGERWRVDSAPGEVYSVLTHPERFEPVHDIARALIAYLERTYDVTVSEDPELLFRVPGGFSPITAVGLTPVNQDAAPITVVFTDLPGIALRAGALYVEPLPVCGCDACDDTWEAVADELEWRVLAVVEGGFTERVTRGLRAHVGHTLTRADSWRGAEGRSGPDTTRRDLAAARSRLATIDGAWAAWSPREP